MGKKEQIETATAIYKEALAAIDRANAMIEAGTTAAMLKYSIAVAPKADGTLEAHVFEGLAQIAEACGAEIVYEPSTIDGQHYDTMRVGELKHFEIINEE